MLCTTLLLSTPHLSDRKRRPSSAELSAAFLSVFLTHAFTYEPRAVAVRDEQVVKAHCSGQFGVPTNSPCTTPTVLLVRFQPCDTKKNKSVWAEWNIG